MHSTSLNNADDFAGASSSSAVSPTAVLAPGIAAGAAALAGGSQSGGSNSPPGVGGAFDEFGGGSSGGGGNGATATSDVELRVKKAADQSCWSNFVLLCFLALGLLIVVIWSQWQSSGGAVQSNSLEYFVLCMIGGVLSGLPHLILTPMDQVKCRMQTGEFASLIDGMRHVWNTANMTGSGPQTLEMDAGASASSAAASSSSCVASAGAGAATAATVAGSGSAAGSSCSPILPLPPSSSSPAAASGTEKEPAKYANVSIWTRIGALYRGWAATLIGYSLQGALKMSLYEYFKWTLKAQVGAEAAKQHQVLLFLAASCCAETVADVFLAPWEAVKVKVQTNAQIQPVMAQVVPRMFRLEGFHGFFKGLPPLWMRQVPYSMTKFATFEKTVEFMYAAVLRARKADVSPMAQLSVSLSSGFIAGVFCTLVSHPADSVVSKLNQRVDSRVGAWQVAQELGCNGLWKGIGARIVFVGTLTALQWLIYDSFKVAVGLSTSGGGVVPAAGGAGGLTAVPGLALVTALVEHHAGRMPHQPRL